MMSINLIFYMNLSNCLRYPIINSMLHFPIIMTLFNSYCQLGHVMRMLQDGCQIFCKQIINIISHNCYNIQSWTTKMNQIQNPFLTAQSTQIKSVISVPIKDFIHHYPRALFNDIPQGRYAL